MRLACERFLLRSKDQFILLSVVLGLFGVYSIVQTSLQCSQSVVSHTLWKSNHVSLVVSELPGYTGWARPPTTLASHFRIKQHDDVARVRHNWTVTVTCDGCSEGQAVWFYARAYGPSILNGVIEHDNSTDDYAVTFHPVWEGQYTVEVVLTYSHPIDFDHFPLTEQQLPPFYEGYLLPMFPLQLMVVKGLTEVDHDRPYCTKHQLTLTEQSRVENPMWSRASWKVTSNNRLDSSASSTRNSTVSPVLSREAYVHGHSSVGFTASYEFTECRLVPDYVPSKVTTALPCLNPISDKIHLVMIGDSVMLLQKEWMEQQLALPSVTVPEVNISLLEIWGGVLRCARLTGANLTTFVRGLDNPAGPRVVVFNTGLHEIFRLCSDEQRKERLLYLTESELQMKCTALYRIVIRDFISAILDIPADVYVFQTTTAGWLRYGNYGVAWDPEMPQVLPLDASFAERFNDIAMDEIQARMRGRGSTEPRIYIVDAYWITLARPDNREIGGTGRKLVHPGLEVASAAVRMWWQVALLDLCDL